MPRSKCRPNVSTYHEAVSFLLTAIDPGLSLPLTKKEDKFTAKSLCYLAGMLGLCIDAKIQEIYETMQITYHAPDEFVTWVRVMQQECLGVKVPASYGNFASNLERVNLFLASLKSATLTDNHYHDDVDRTEYLDKDEQLEDEETDPRENWQDHDYYLDEDEFLEDEEFYQENSRLLGDARGGLTLIEDTEVGEMAPVKPKQDWDTLAAKNPLAAAFVKSLMSAPDVEGEEQWSEPVDDDTVFDHHGTWEYLDTDDYSDEE
jgi:hypothetical protein